MPRVPTTKSKLPKKTPNASKKKSPAAGAASPATQPSTPTSPAASSNHTPSPARPSPRSDGADDDDDDDTILAGTHRPQISDGTDASTGMHPLTAIGRHLGRTGNLFVPVKSMLKLGLYNRKKLEDAAAADAVPIGDDEESEYDVVEVRCINAFERAVEINPDLESYIRKYGVQYVCNMITNARRNARGEDILKIKDVVVTPRFRAWTPPIADYEDPKQRGWYHAEMCAMLCPTSIDHKDPETLRKLKHKLLKPSPLLYPPFMYKDEKIYPNNLFRGFLKNLDVAKSGRILFHGPRAMDGGPASNKSVSKTYDMTEMTLPAIAYVTTIHAYGISCDEKFDPEGRTGFAYRQFYNGLLDHLDALKPKQRSIILSWWNRQLFPADANPSASLPEGVKASAEEMEEQGEQDEDDDGDEYEEMRDN